jgi:hypothetical protein
MVPRGGLSLGPFNISKINHLTPPQIPALYQANVPMSTVNKGRYLLLTILIAANESTQMPAAEVEKFECAIAL